MSAAVSENRAADPLEELKRHFLAEIAAHEMRILHEDGLYRHIRFQRPGTFAHGFEIVTWPGHLSLCGDLPGYTFTRMPDMISFFSGGDLEINPRYWSEKLTNPATALRRYSRRAFEQYVADAFAGLPELGYEPGEIRAIKAAWAEHARHRPAETAEQAREALRTFAPETGFRFDISEADLSEWDPQFIYACLAIRFGCNRYLEHAARRRAS